MNKFIKLVKIRRNIAGKKYYDSNGVNTALYARNNLKDIVEELSDAYEISSLFHKRLSILNQERPLIFKEVLLLIKTKIFKFIFRIIGNKLIKYIEKYDYLFNKDIERIIWNMYEGKEY